MDTLFHPYQRRLFEDAEVLREVSASQAQGLQQVSKINSACFVKDTENAEPSSLMDNFVKSFCWV